jgi:hypothetical protein
MTELLPVKGIRECRIDFSLKFKDWRELRDPVLKSLKISFYTTDNA